MPERSNLSPSSKDAMQILQFRKFPIVAASMRGLFGRLYLSFEKRWHFFVDYFCRLTAAMISKNRVELLEFLCNLFAPDEQNNA